MAGKKKLRGNRNSEPVDIDDKPYTVKEMGGPGLTEWMNLNASRLILVNGKPNGFRRADDMATKLISLCLHDEAGQLVPEATIAAWGTETLMELQRMCRKINGLDDDSEEAEKKS